MYAIRSYYAMKFSTENKIVMFRERKPTSFQENLIARSGKILVLPFHTAEHLADPAVVELAALLRDGFAHRDTAELAALLGHEDRRARRGAQHVITSYSIHYTKLYDRRSHRRP